jgi:hypothetical protein
MNLAEGAIRIIGERSETADACSARPWSTLTGGPAKVSGRC